MKYRVTPVNGLWRSGRQPLLVKYWYSAKSGLTGSRPQYNWEKARLMMIFAKNLAVICITDDKIWRRLAAHVRQSCHNRIESPTPRSTHHNQESTGDSIFASHKFIP
ncbi:hypothetical protein PYW07_012643 [Mythimna separata]|uniref:Uncharacterized protein n=1 Tax=Mythimna separata TaxID=271217 RepID=A0AAD8DL04_MYTSE|nr:hypothetical protein PYW07_012643 [Mythimna separata]